MLAVSIPGPYRVSNVCTGFVAATYQSLSVRSPLGASCERVPGLLTSCHDCHKYPDLNGNGQSALHFSSRKLHDTSHLLITYLLHYDTFTTRLQPVADGGFTALLHYERVVNVFIQCDRFHNVFIPSSYRSTPSSCRLLVAGATRPKF